jgi:hypothetical protein
MLIGISDVLQSCIPGMRARLLTTREGKFAVGGEDGLAATTGIMMVRLRGGMGRITRTDIEDRPSQSLSERVANMGVEDMKRLGRYLAYSIPFHLYMLCDDTALCTGKWASLMLMLCKIPRT